MPTKMLMSFPMASVSVDPWWVEIDTISRLMGISFPDGVVVEKEGKGIISISSESDAAVRKLKNRLIERWEKPSLHM